MFDWLAVFWGLSWLMDVLGGGIPELTVWGWGYEPARCRKRNGKKTKKMAEGEIEISVVFFVSIQNLGWPHLPHHWSVIYKYVQYYSSSNCDIILETERAKISSIHGSIVGNSLPALLRWSVDVWARMLAAHALGRPSARSEAWSILICCRQGLKQG